MIKLHKLVRERIEKVNEMYKKNANKGRTRRSFEVGDLVWVHLRKERFPGKRKHKLMPHAEGPFKILAKYGDNAYKLDLGDDSGVASTFKIGDLSPYLEDTQVQELRTIPFQEGEDDQDQETSAEKELLLSRHEINGAGRTFELHGFRLAQGHCCVTW